jgi:hypothetical protein
VVICGLVKKSEWDLDIRCWFQWNRQDLMYLLVTVWDFLISMKDIMVEVANMAGGVGKMSCRVSGWCLVMVL